MAAPAENGEQAETFPEGAEGAEGTDDLQAYYEQDPELAAMMGHAKQMEAEAEQLAAVQSELERSVASSGTGTPLSPTSTATSRSGTAAAATNADPAASAAGGAGAAGGSAPTLSLEEKEELDKRSIFVGNVDYAATAEELEQHFHGCGAIQRVTIICDKFTRQPKGFAYIEFTDAASVAVAIALDDSLFRGRQLKVMPKRTNLPGVNRGRGRGGFRGGRGGGGGGGGYPPPYYYGYPPYPYPPPHFGPPVFRGGRARRRASWYTPY